jgi:hypothetical protein
MKKALIFLASLVLVVAVNAKLTTEAAHTAAALGM